MILHLKYIGFTGITPSPCAVSVKGDVCSNQIDRILRAIPHLCTARNYIETDKIWNLNASQGSPAASADRFPWSNLDHEFKRGFPEIPWNGCGWWWL